MNKFIIANDIHLKGNTPINRIDNYKISLLAKCKEIVNIATELQCDGIIVGGDLFENSIIGNILLDDFLDIVEGGVPWYVIPGNHDEIGNNWSASGSSSLAHAIRRCPNIYEFKTLYGSDWIIEGYEYYHGLEKDMIRVGLYTHEDKAFKIAIVHGLITEKKLLPTILHAPIQNIKSNYDVVIVAHNHSQKGIFKVDNTNYIFNGCIGRRKINEAGIHPSVLYLNCETKEMYPILLKQVGANEEIFNIEVKEAQDEYNEDMNAFIQNLKDSNIEGVDLRGLIEYVCAENKESQNVVDYLISKVGEYENE